MEGEGIEINEGESLRDGDFNYFQLRLSWINIVGKNNRCLFK